MQSRQIILHLKPSKFPPAALLLLFAFNYIISSYIPYSKYLVFGIFVLACIFWLYKYLTFKRHNIVLNTLSQKILLNQNEVQIIKFKHISWWLSIIYINSQKTNCAVMNPAQQQNNRNLQKNKIYLFADSVPLKSYKSFKAYSLWT
jgi:hypothetical protein